ncbi:uncharacterized protein LOC135837547 isoform X2 [Planococcus citri]|uniref:uncharacterized protein LOC135837547 isoform X2 n=1 Tax=Planococcus citri TaxID=170843 RepID=UPI0031FA101E
MDGQSSSKRLKLSSDVDGEAGDGGDGREAGDGDVGREADDGGVGREADDNGIRTIPVSEGNETEIKQLLYTLFPELLFPIPVQIPELFALISSTPSSVCLVKNQCCVAVLALVDLNNVVGEKVLKFLDDHFDVLNDKKFLDENSRYALLINERKLDEVNFNEIHPQLRSLIRNMTEVDRLILISKMAKYKDPGQERTSLVYANKEEADLQNKANTNFRYTLNITQDWPDHVISPPTQSKCVQVRQVGVFKMDKTPEILQSLDKYAEDGVSAKKSGSLYSDSDSAESRHHDEPTDYTFDEPIDSDMEEAICGSSSSSKTNDVPVPVPVPVPESKDDSDLDELYE